MCDGVYNSTILSPPDWYLQWEREIENWTQRNIALTNIPTSEIRTQLRLARNTRKINLTEREEFSIPRLIIRRNTVFPIAYSFLSVTPLSEVTNLSSTLNLTLISNGIHSIMTETTTYTPNAFTQSVTPQTDTIKPALLIHEVPHEAPLLRTHDQEMIRSSRITAAKLLCKLRLSQWTVAGNTIFL